MQPGGRILTLAEGKLGEARRRLERHAVHATPTLNVAGSLLHLRGELVAGRQLRSSSLSHTLGEMSLAHDHW